MLTKDKNEIIESICKDLEKASDSAFIKLAKSFDVPLQEESEFMEAKNMSASDSTWVKNVSEQNFFDEKNRKQPVYVEVSVAKPGKKPTGETIIVKGVLVPEDIIHNLRVYNFLNMGSNFLGKRNNKNKHFSLISDKKVPKASKGRKAKNAEIRNREVNSVEAD
jgi:hypothetical protein